MRFVMAGLDHKSASLDVREAFAITREKTRRILATLTTGFCDGVAAPKGGGAVGGCVIISTCNRTELYASVAGRSAFRPAEFLCGALAKDYPEFRSCFTERAGEQAIAHLCRVASGLESQIVGDDQIITQVREAVELSRAAGCADSYTERAFMTAIQAAKAVKTSVMLKTPGIDSIPGKAVEMLSRVCPPKGRDVVVIGNGATGRLVSELLIREEARVTVTLREYKKGVAKLPRRACAVGYGERYAAIEKSDITVSATTSPHYTLCYDELRKLERRPEVIVDLAVPRDVEPAVREIPGVTLFCIDDISGEGRRLQPDGIEIAEKIIGLHMEKYNRWLAFKENAAAMKTGGAV